MPSPTKPRARGPGPHPFRRGDVWWCRIPTPRPPAVRRSLETTDKRVALSRCAMLRQLADRGDWDTLSHLADGTRDLAAVHAAWSAQQLPGFLAAERARENDPDLAPYVTRWLAHVAGEGVKSAAKYGVQLRTLIPEGTPFPRSAFTKARVRDWLDQQRPKTRNRYRAAASSFAEYLLERDLLEYNPARAVKPAPPAKARVRYLTSAEAQAFVAALPDAPRRALHALLLGTGGDLGGVLRVRRRDLDLARGEVRIPGTKAHTRDAVRRFLADWTLPIVRDYLRDQPAVPLAFLFAPLFDAEREAGAPTEAEVRRITGREARVVRAACTAVGLEDYTTRDHRHTFAVQALRDGYSFHVVAHQLGHGTTALVHKVYGRFAVSDADYARRTAVQLEDAPNAGAL